MLVQTFLDELCPWKWCVLEQFSTAAHGKDPCWSGFWRTVSHGRDSTLQQGKRVMWKTQKKRSVADWSQPPFPIPPAPLRGVRNEEVKLSLGRRGRWEEGILELCLCFSLPCFYLAINWSSPSQVCLPVVVTAKESPCLHLYPTHEISHSFLPVLLRRQGRHPAANQHWEPPQILLLSHGY